MIYSVVRKKLRKYNIIFCKNQMLCYCTFQPITASLYLHINWMRSISARLQASTRESTSNASSRALVALFHDRS